jgi:hypothetical protein
VPDLFRLDGIQRLGRFMNVDRLQVERVGITDDLEVLLGDLHDARDNELRKNE